MEFARFDLIYPITSICLINADGEHDEATSALDAESESVIHSNMKAMSEGRTVLIIAHRLSALRHANRIVTMENGQITESGSHDELLRQNGRYASLWREQMGQFTGGRT